MGGLLGYGRRGFGRVFRWTGPVPARLAAAMRLERLGASGDDSVLRRRCPMSEGELADQQRSAESFGSRHGAIADFPRRTGNPSAAVVSFDTHELREIFNLYGRRVAEGEWREYAIGFTNAQAGVSI